jgi:hypothetical protein
MSTSLLYSSEHPPELLIQRLKIDKATLEHVIPKGNIIIQWGNYVSEGLNRKVLNAKEAVQVTRNKRTAHEVLQLNGVPSIFPDSTKRKRSSKYVIPVFHGEALSVFKTHTSNAWLTDPGKQSYKEWRSEINSKTWKDVTKIATRAVYALGLDFSLVLISTDSRGGYYVIDVDPAPRLNQRMAQLFASAIHQYTSLVKEEQLRGSTVVLGMDPEFVLRDKKGNLVSASKYLSKRGSVGCDAIWLSGNRSIFPLAEFRPKPAIEPRELIINLYRTMNLATKKIKDSTLEWLAGGLPIEGYPLGGHIHMSNIWKNSFLVRVLDNYLTLPLLMLEDSRSGRRRPKYGFLGDVRTQFHGGFEYRTPPSWIVSPTVAKGVIALSRLIADHYWRLDQYPLLSPAVQRAFYNGDKGSLIPLVKSQWADLMKLPNYEKYRSYLEPLKNQMFAMQSWNENQDIRKSWKLPPFHHSLSIR